MSVSAVQSDYKIKVEKTTHSRLSQTDFDNLPFGAVFADHMLVADYRNGQWQDPVIVPYGHLSMSPAMSALHYGQSIFEGMKAYRDQNNVVKLFRPYDHLERLNRSAERLCMPPVPESLFINGLLQLMQVDAEWTPRKEGSALYIRPLYYGTDEYVGVHPSDNCRLIIFSCPVNAFYKGSVKAMVTNDYSRAVEGGVGFVKTSGNYARAMYASKKAKELGYDVVMWLDAINKKYVEEFSTMNAFFVIDGQVVTPRLNNRILAGITRDSIIQLLRDEGVHVHERDVAIEEIIDAAANGLLEEAFGTGTAAVISPLASIHFEQEQKREGIFLPEYHKWKIAPMVAQHLAEIRSGARPDTRRWLMEI